MNSILLLPASLFSCCVCVVNVRRRALLLVLLCKCGTLHAKAVTELLRKQHITQREKREAEQKQRLLQKTSYGIDWKIEDEDYIYHNDAGTKKLIRLHDSGMDNLERIMIFGLEKSLEWLLSKLSIGPFMALLRVPCICGFI